MNNKKLLQFLVFGLLSLIIVVFFGQQVHAQNTSTSEQIMINEINRARSNPPAYASWMQTVRQTYDPTNRSFQIPGQNRFGVIGDLRAFDEAISELQRTAPVTMVAPSNGLGLAAAAHAREQSVATSNGQISHTGKDGSSPTDRANRYGSTSTGIWENIGTGPSPEFIVMNLMLDYWEPTRGHRSNFLTPTHRLVGVGCSNSSIPGAGLVCVMNFAQAYSENTGVRPNPSNPLPNQANRQPVTPPTSTAGSPSQPVVPQGIGGILQGITGVPQGINDLIQQANSALGGNNFSTAEQILRRVINLDPNNIVAYINLGNVFRDQGNLVEAIANYLIAISLNPNNTEAQNNLQAAQQSLAMQGGSPATTDTNNIPDISGQWTIISQSYNLGANCEVINFRGNEYRSSMTINQNGDRITLSGEWPSFNALTVGSIAQNQIRTRSSAYPIEFVGTVDSDGNTINVTTLCQGRSAGYPMSFRRNSQSQPNTSSTPPQPSQNPRGLRRL